MVGLIRIVHVSLIGMLLVVSPTLAQPALGGNNVEIRDRNSKSKLVVSRELLRTFVSVDQEISKLGVRLYDYDTIEVGLMSDKMIGLQVARIPKDGVDTGGPLTIKDGFKAILDAKTFKIISIFKLEGGEIALP